MVQTMGLHGSNVEFAWFKRRQVLFILILALIFVFILPSSYGSPERPMYKGLRAWEDGAFIPPSSSHIPSGIPLDDAFVLNIIYLQFVSSVFVFF